ncbi:MAG TPA: hypothetical protein VFQ77_03385 [Pseudonocardiaceae bacterium]|nr:hypothetical protein [Pseudonocardiaceae bacterium]
MNTPEHDAPLDEVDDAILAGLARLYDRIDPVPAGLADRIDFAVSLADLDAEVARLQHQLAEPAGVRGEERARTVTFTSESLTVMVTVTAVSNREFRMDGWAAPGGGLRVELRSESGSRDGHTDSDGRFEFDGVPLGRAQLVFHPVDGSDLRVPVVTPAVEL